MVRRGTGSPARELAGCWRNRGAGFLALLLLAAWAALAAPGARAAIPPEQDPFYRYEGKTSLKHIPPGTVLKTRTVSVHIEGIELPLTAVQLLYRSTSELGKPTVNDPRKIQRTTRDMVAELLIGIDGCRIPRISRQQAGTELSVESLRAALPQATSILARPVGTHGGDDFDKIDGEDALAAYLAKPAGTDRYFIEYADYRSADGFFRKYRFIFVNGEVLPYHLAICDDWKVHHVNTDMANQKWMQDEEAAFLTDPARVFNEAHYRALAEIQRRIGLEYFGIDCSVDTNGELLVFEVNASMLVHDDNAEFPYKNPAVYRIKAAFDAMLARIAKSDG